MTERDKKRVLMASLDTRRPAAQEQLKILGEQTGIDTLPIVAGQTPPQIARRAMEAGRLGGYDVVMLDTAGRLHIDEALMAEMVEMRDTARPHETLLVADSLTGQDAVNLARTFDERIGVTGIVLTRIDGDGRGGAALSMRAVTGKPIKLLGTGEKLDGLEDFHPERVAGRILGMGDVVSLVERAAATIDAEKAQKTAAKMQKGEFDLQDLADQLGQMQKLGGMSSHPRHAARHRQDEEAARRLRPRRQDVQAASRDHLLDDAEGAPQSEDPGGEPQAAHRRRLRHQRAGDQQAAEDAPPDGRHDEERLASGKGGLAKMFGMGGGMPEMTPEMLEAVKSGKMPGGANAAGDGRFARRNARIAGRDGRPAEGVSGRVRRIAWAAGEEEVMIRLHFRNVPAKRGSSLHELVIAMHASKVKQRLPMCTFSRMRNAVVRFT